MVFVNVSEAKAQLSALIEKVLRGEGIVICKAGKPIAKLVQFNGAGKKREPGALSGKIKIAPDFDELPADIAQSFGVED